MTNINGLNNCGTYNAGVTQTSDSNLLNNYLNPEKKPETTVQRVSFDSAPDTFGRERDKSKNGKFDWSEAAKNFVKGIISPVSALIKNPLMSLAIMGGTAVLCSAAPIVVPYLAGFFALYSVGTLAKGSVDLYKNLKNKDYDAAEKSFKPVGEGLAGTIISLAGVKKTSATLKEAKLMKSRKLDVISSADRQNIAAEVNKEGFFGALKNVFDFKNNSGLGDSQFTSTGMKARLSDTGKTLLSDFKNLFKGNKTRNGIDLFKKLWAYKGQYKKAATVLYVANNNNMASKNLANNIKSGLQVRKLKKETVSTNREI